MKKLLLTLGLIAFLGISAQADSIDLTLYAGAPVNPGDLYSWNFTLTNNSGYLLFINSVDSTFPTDDGVAGGDPAVTADLDLFNTLYADGLPTGQTSDLLPLATYLVSAAALHGAQAGDGISCCLITVSGDLFTESFDYGGPFSVSAYATVMVKGADIGPIGDDPLPSDATPEPKTMVTLLVGGLAILGAKTRRSVVG